jgi:hypothetical protein
MRSAYDEAEMSAKTISALALLLVLRLPAQIPANPAVTQQNPPAAASTEPDVTFSFPVQPGGEPFRFESVIDKDRYVTGISIFYPGETASRQTLSTCGGKDETLDELYQAIVETGPLLKHADLNFDGFEDLKLLYYYIPHLGKRLDCIYVWDKKTQRYIYSIALTKIATNLEPDPESKTLTTREDWMFGPWEESTYRWIGGKPVLVEQTSLLGGWGQPNKPCGFDFSCSRRIHGKMTTTLAKPICEPEEMDDLPQCPAAPAIPKAYLRKPASARK